MRSFEYEGSRFDVWERVYEPAEDSFMLLQAAMEREAERVLEIGTGCGLISILLRRARNAWVVATDVSVQAARCAHFNAKSLGVELDLVVSDMFSAIKGEFDLIVFNPPYLPVDQGGMDSAQWAGGILGRGLIDRFIAGLDDYLNPGGCGMFVQSSLNKPPQTRAMAAKHRLSVNVLREESFFFERLQVIELSR